MTRVYPASTVIFANLIALDLKGALTYAEGLCPLPPKRQYLNCAENSAQRPQLATLVHDKEDQSPSLQRVLWMYNEDMEGAEDHQQDKELSVDWPGVKSSSLCCG